MSIRQSICNDLVSVTKGLRWRMTGHIERLAIPRHRQSRSPIRHPRAGVVHALDVAHHEVVAPTRHCRSPLRHGLVKPKAWDARAGAVDLYRKNVLMHARLSLIEDETRPVLPQRPWSLCTTTTAIDTCTYSVRGVLTISTYCTSIHSRQLG